MFGNSALFFFSLPTLPSAFSLFILSSLPQDKIRNKQKSLPGFWSPQTCLSFSPMWGGDRGKDPCLAADVEEEGTGPGGKAPHLNTIKGLSQWTVRTGDKPEHGDLGVWPVVPCQKGHQAPVLPPHGRLRARRTTGDLRSPWLVCSIGK